MKSFTVFGRLMITLAFAFIMGLALQQALPAAAQNSTIITPPSNDTFETSSGPGDYLFSAAYDCTPGSHPPQTISLDSTIAFNQLIAPACSTVHTEFYIEICGNPTGNTSASGEMRLASGLVFPVTLQPSYPGSPYFEIETDTPVMDTPVAFTNITVNDRFISYVGISYECGSGTTVDPLDECSRPWIREGVVANEYPNCPQIVTIPLNPVPGTTPTCPNGNNTSLTRFGLILSDIWGCSGYASGQAFAVFADGTQQLLPNPFTHLTMDTQCILPKEPVAVRLVANSGQSILRARAHAYRCCYCEQ